MERARAIRLNCNGQALHYGYGRANAFRSVSLYTPADTTAPVVSSVATKTGRQVEVTFSEKMGSGVTTPGNYTLSGSGKGTLASNPSTVSWVSGYKYLLEWLAGEMIAGTGNITITVGAAVKDVAGNSIGTPASGNANGSRIIHAINCGPVPSKATDPIYPFESQRNYWSGAGNANLNAVTGVVNNDGTPTAVYGSERNILTSPSYPGDIIHTLPNISLGVNHAVRLYFFDNGYSIEPGDVEFDVYINNVLKIANLDLITAAGGARNGFWMEFPNITASGGAIAVRIVPKQTWNQTWGAYYFNATISGIKVTAM